MLAAGCRLLPLAAENQGHRRGKSSLLAHERTVVKSTFPLLSYQGVRRLRLSVVRSLQLVLKLFLFKRLLTGVCSLLFDAGLGLITGERVMFDQAAKLKTSVRSGTGRSPDSWHRQWGL